MSTPAVKTQAVIFGKKTEATLLATWRGAVVEVRQHDIISGENSVMLNEETILKLAEMIRGK